MATKAHCIYTFESLNAKLNHTSSLGLTVIQEKYSTNTNHSPIASPVTASSPSPTTTDSHPLFVTWNIADGNSDYELRGCIGTFEPLPLEQGLRQYALIAALQDTRFSPITTDDLPKLQVCVTLLTDFSEPTHDVMDWTIGEHGLRLQFSDNGRTRNGTYLPDVAAEQGWTKEQTITSLMRKTGWRTAGKSYKDYPDMTIVRYQGKKVAMEYAEYKEWITAHASEAA